MRQKGKISPDKNNCLGDKKMKDLKSRLGLGSLPKSCALSLLLTVPFSQIYADEARSALEEVVVTAQKKEQSLMDAAIDVTAFSGEQLTVSGIDDVFGISKAIPGLTIDESYGDEIVVTIIATGLRKFNLDEFSNSYIRPVRELSPQRKESEGYVNPVSLRLIDINDVIRSIED